MMELDEKDDVVGGGEMMEHESYATEDDDVRLYF
jgi:hypothetical protein